MATTLPHRRALGLLLVTGLVLPGAAPAIAEREPDPPPLPDELVLTGVVRDFKERSAAGGHPDFERQPIRGFGHYVGLVADTLDADGKPAWAGSGKKVTAQWKDASGANVIRPKAYLASKPGDTAGAVESQEGGACTGADSLAQWFRDVPGTNVSAPLAIRLARRPGTNIYTFDDKADPVFASRRGFFPINGTLYGNSGGGGYPDTNYHFTFELHAQFVYEHGTGQVFTFTGDDDVFVFIDGKLVIDLGGVHSAVSQTIDLDRCAWLEDGRTYSFDFFYVERHRTEANCRIDTTLRFFNVRLPAVAALHD